MWLAFLSHGRGRFGLQGTGKTSIPEDPLMSTKSRYLFTFADSGLDSRVYFEFFQGFITAAKRKYFGEANI